MNDLVRLDYSGMMSPAVGCRHGITEQEWKDGADLLPAVRDSVDGDRRSGRLGFCGLPFQDVSPLLRYADDVRHKIQDFVLVGIGGSALGGIALHSALGQPYYNLLPVKARGGPRVFFADNIDPDAFAGLLEVVDPRSTLFNVVTKSGSTAETMGAFLVVRQFLIDAVGDLWRDRFVFTTDPARGDLRKLAEEEGIASFSVPPNVGGRFSVFSPVGLLPAAMAGIDIQGLLDGAASMDRHLSGTTDLSRHLAYAAALLLYLANVQKGKKIVVMMPYVQALRDTADWFRQIWAESLGKRLDTKGRAVEVGQTPVKALGATDQHSQLQLYVEGPNDKVILFVAVEKFHRELPFPVAYPDCGSLGYLAGHTMERLIHAELVATRLALTRSGRPSATFILPEVSPRALGAFLYLLELQTVASGVLYNVNPLDQPGVEEGKVATYALLGRQGYEDKREEIERETSRGKSFVI